MCWLKWDEMEGVLGVKVDMCKSQVRPWGLADLRLIFLYIPTGYRRQLVDPPQSRQRRLMPTTPRRGNTLVEVVVTQELAGCTLQQRRRRRSHWGRVVIGRGTAGPEHGLLVRRRFGNGNGNGEKGSWAKSSCDDALDQAITTTAAGAWPRDRQPEATDCGNKGGTGKQRPIRVEKGVMPCWNGPGKEKEGG